tara:strand:+ start:113 stop:985 length:873 start_codon:yes stop_codon:yes gene_type:complete
MGTYCGDLPNSVCGWDTGNEGVEDCCINPNMCPNDMFCNSDCVCQYHPTDEQCCPEPGADPNANCYNILGQYVGTCAQVNSYSQCLQTFCEGGTSCNWQAWECDSDNYQPPTTCCEDTSICPTSHFCNSNCECEMDLVPWECDCSGYNGCPIDGQDGYCYSVFGQNCGPCDGGSDDGGGTDDGIPTDCQSDPCCGYTLQGQEFDCIGANMTSCITSENQGWGCKWCHNLDECKCQNQSCGGGGGPHAEKTRNRPVSSMVHRRGGRVSHRRGGRVSGGTRNFNQAKRNRRK